MTPLSGLPNINLVESVDFPESLKLIIESGGVSEKNLQTIKKQLDDKTIRAAVIAWGKQQQDIADFSPAVKDLLRAGYYHEPSDDDKENFPNKKVDEVGRSNLESKSFVEWNLTLALFKYDKKNMILDCLNENKASKLIEFIETRLLAVEDCVDVLGSVQNFV